MHIAHAYATIKSLEEGHSKRDRKKAHTHTHIRCKRNMEKNKTKKLNGENCKKKTNEKRIQKRRKSYPYMDLLLCVAFA